MQLEGYSFLANGGDGVRTTRTAPDPERGRPETLPDWEWALSARQVLAVVAAIIAFCEGVGWLLG